MGTVSDFITDRLTEWALHGSYEFDRAPAPGDAAPAAAKASAWFHVIEPGPTQRAHPSDERS